MDIIALAISMIATPLFIWLFSRDNFSGRWHKFSELANYHVIEAGKFIGGISVTMLGRRVAILLTLSGLFLLISFQKHPEVANSAAAILYGGILSAWLFWPAFSQTVYLAFFGLALIYSLFGILLDFTGLLDLGTFWNGMPPPPKIPGLLDLSQIGSHGLRLLILLVFLFVALWLFIWAAAILWVGSIALGMLIIVKIGRLLHTDWSPKPIFNLTSAALFAVSLATFIHLVVGRLSTGG